MNLNQVFALHSDRVARATVQALTFGLRSRLTAHVARYNRIIDTVRRYEEQHRTIPARLASDRELVELQARVTAEQLASVDAQVQSRWGSDAIDFADIRPSKIGSEDELRKIAEAAKVPLDLVKKTRLAAAEKQYQQSVGAAALAESFFWEARGDMASTEIKVPAQMVANAIERTRLFILGWSKPDFAELALIALDDTAVAAHMDAEDGAGEGSREIDEQLASADELSQGAASGK